MCVCVLKWEKAHQLCMGWLSFSLQTRKHTSTDFLTLQHTLSVWPFPFTTVVAHSNVSCTDKVYQLTHLSLLTITHMCNGPHRHVSFFALFTDTCCLCTCVCVCVCVHVWKQYKWCWGLQVATKPSRLEYTSHIIAHKGTQKLEHTHIYRHTQTQMPFNSIQFNSILFI